MNYMINHATVDFLYEEFRRASSPITITRLPKTYRIDYDDKWIVDKYVPLDKDLTVGRYTKKAFLRYFRSKRYLLQLRQEQAEAKARTAQQLAEWERQEAYAEVLVKIANLTREFSRIAKELEELHEEANRLHADLPTNRD